MHGLGLLLNHYETISIDHNLSIENSASVKLLQLNLIKSEFEKDLNEKGKDSINNLIGNFFLIKLLELEPLRLDYSQRIQACKDLANVEETNLSAIYKDAIEVSGGESWKDLYAKKENEEVNRDMYLRMKLASLTELRKEDANRINKLEKTIENLVARLNALEARDARDDFD